MVPRSKTGKTNCSPSLDIAPYMVLGVKYQTAKLMVRHYLGR